MHGNIAESYLVLLPESVFASTCQHDHPALHRSLSYCECVHCVGGWPCICRVEIGVVMMRKLKPPPHSKPEAAPSCEMGFRWEVVASDGDVVASFNDECDALEAAGERNILSASWKADVKFNVRDAHEEKKQ